LAVVAFGFCSEEQGMIICITASKCLKFSAAANHTLGDREMFTRRNLFSLTLAAVGLAMLAGDANSAMAQSSGNRVRLTASMQSGRTKAVAKYEQRDARRKFTFELEKGVPRTTITVRHNGFILATRQVDALGQAKVDFDTNDGHAVPVMNSGQPVSVWVGNQLMMKGTLR
jgi:hypothetical protein